MDNGLQQNLDRLDGDLDAFRQTSLEYAQNPESLGNQMIVAKAFESLVESTWRALGSKIAASGKIAPRSPGEIFVIAQDLGIIIDASDWLEALDYHKKLRESADLNTTQEALDFSQTYFTDAIDDLSGSRKNWR